MSDQVDATPRTADEQAVIAELLPHVPNFQYMPADTQRSLIDGALAARRNQRNGNGHDDRNAQVQARFRELARQRGLDPDHPELWRGDQYSIRYECIAQAQAEIPEAPPPEVDDFSGDRHEALQQARHDHAEAVANNDKAKAACARATAGIERELARFDGVDEQLATWEVQQIKDEADDEIPYPLASALKDKALACDRHDRARAAKLRLDAERRHSEANLNLAAQQLRQAASRIVYAEGIPLAEALAQAEADWLDKAERLLALAHSTLDQSSPLPAAVVAAVNRPLPQPQRKDNLVDAWRVRHREVMAGDA